MHACMHACKPHYFLLSPSIFIHTYNYLIFQIYNNYLKKIYYYVGNFIRMDDIKKIIINDYKKKGDGER